MYEYQVRGERLLGKKVRFGELYWAWPMCARWFLPRRFSAGAPAVVYYSPTDPSDAVLEPGLNVLSCSAFVFMLALNVPTAMVIYKVVQAI